jgi:hypothetical protein
MVHSNVIVVTVVGTAYRSSSPILSSILARGVETELKAYLYLLYSKATPLFVRKVFTIVFMCDITVGNTPEIVFRKPSLTGWFSFYV